MGHLALIVSLTNSNLRDKNDAETTAGEVLKFFGILVLMTRFKFHSRRDLRAAKNKQKLIPTPLFGHFMSEKKFETFRRNIHFSFRPSSEANSEDPVARWKLIDEFVIAINEHREENFSPSHFICVDESMRCWYGVGGNWIWFGLPNYIPMDRKPENGCEIQSSCCRCSKISLRLNMVKHLQEYSDEAIEKELSDNIQPGTKELIELVKPWIGTQRIVCVDTNFTSVSTTELLYQKVTRFIGVVKNSTRRFHMKFLGEYPLDGRGDSESIV